MTPKRPSGSLATFWMYSSPWRSHSRAALTTSHGTDCSRSYLAATGRMTSVENLRHFCWNSICSSVRRKSTGTPSLTDQSIVSRPAAKRSAKVSPVTRLPSLLLACCALFAGCSIGDDNGDTPPQIGVKADDDEAAEDLGFPFTATKNTTRVGGGDPIADVAGVAGAVWPATSESTRPNAVVLVDEDNWQGGIAASVLAGTSIGAPILLSDGDDLPAVSADTLDRLDPKGSDLTKGAEVIRIGSGPPEPDGRKTT